MKKLLSVFCLLIVYLYSSILQADAEKSNTTNTNSTELKTLLAPIHSLQGGFQQTVKNEKGKVLQRLSGKVWLKKPAQFRWEVIGKDQRLVVADGKKVWDFDKDLDQVTVQKLDKGQAQAPIYFLTGDSNSIDQDFQIKAINSSNNNSNATKAAQKNIDQASEKSQHCLQESTVCFELKPKRKEGPFQWIRIGFKDKVLKEMQMLDQLGQYSQFIFTDVKVNQNISSKEFQFVPPSTADVINNG